MIARKDEFNEQIEEQELDNLLSKIKEEFFDNRIRAYKLTKMGLIKLFPFIKVGKELDFVKALKNK